MNEHLHGVCQRVVALLAAQEHGPRAGLRRPPVPLVGLGVGPRGLWGRGESPPGWQTTHQLNVSDWLASQLARVAAILFPSAFPLSRRFSLPSVAAAGSVGAVQVASAALLVDAALPGDSTGRSARREHSRLRMVRHAAC